MLGSRTLIIVVIGYVGFLIAAGYAADRPSAQRRGTVLSPLLYSLSLATRLSAWSYLAAVADAGKGSWLFLANALGPVLALTIGYPVWRRVAVLSKQENFGSLADFLSSRYGKSRTLAILCALTATAGALPAIALQLYILLRVWEFAAGSPGQREATGLILITFLAVVAVVFGARRPSLTQHNRGFISMLAVEACVKMAGLLSVAVFAVVLLSRIPDGPARTVAAIPPLLPGLNTSFFTLTFLSAVTMFTLPRQFHLGFVALEKVGDVRTARWLVPAYFLCIVLATLLIAAAIRAGLAVHVDDPALQLVALPLAYGARFLALVVLLGGLSAGAGLVVAEATATSAMISNELILPLLGRTLQRRLSAIDASRMILYVRRGTIILVAGMAWLYYVAVQDLRAPTHLIETALTAFAQFLPAVVGAVYWRSGHKWGAIVGIVSGMAIWGTTVVAPTLISAPAYRAGVWHAGNDISLSLPVILSLVVNAVLYILVSLWAKRRPIDIIQARIFVGDPVSTLPRHAPRIKARFSDVRDLLVRFMGEEDAEKALFELRASTGGDLQTDTAIITPTFVRMVEKLLAGVIGAPSARNVLSIAITSEFRAAGDIDLILDEAAHAVQFSRERLQTTLESLAEGICVIDGDLRLVTWNAGFFRLLALPLARVYVGQPLQAVLPGGQPDNECAGPGLRLLGLGDRIRGHEPFYEDWQAGEGRTLRVSGKPLSQGDYLITVSDITELKAAQLVLAQDKEVLERRVTERTQELSAVNTALADAKLVAERATSAQKRFVAAASHDLVQPMHAARLFIGNVLPALEGDETHFNLLQRADQAVDAAHGLMRALLNLSSLETGGVEPNLAAVDAGSLFDSLFEEFAPQARLRGLDLVVRPTRRWVRTDRDLLRSVLQNLLQNALRYTPSGRVLLAARYADGHVRFEVRDTGIGIEPEKVEAAFDEYGRLAEGRSLAQGAGLGLAIVARICQVLGHSIAVRSRPGAGSVFAVTVPGAAPVVPAMPVRLPNLNTPSLGGLRVLCIDDERESLFGLKALIERWGGQADAVCSAEELQGRTETWDVIIADHHLPGETGLSVLRAVTPRPRLRLLVTASPEEGWESALPEEGIYVFRKPIAPLSLREMLSGLVTGGRQEDAGGRLPS